MAELTGNPGFAPPRAEKTLSKRRLAALELIATVALTLALVVAATAVAMANKSLARGAFAVERPSMQMPTAAPRHRTASR